MLWEEGLLSDERICLEFLHCVSDDYVSSSTNHLYHRIRCRIKMSFPLCVGDEGGVTELWKMTHHRTGMEWIEAISKS